MGTHKIVHEQLQNQMIQYNLRYSIVIKTVIVLKQTTEISYQLMRATKKELRYERTYTNSRTNI